MRSRFLVISFIVAALWLLSACANLATPSPTSPLAPTPTQALVPSPEPTSVTMVMGDHYFEPDSLSLKAAQPVRLEVLNNGQIPHAVMVGRDLGRLTWGPNERLEEDFFSGINLRRTIDKGVFSTSRGTDVLLYQGGSAILSFTPPASKAGVWEVGCLIPGHYESGMRGTLTVSP